VRVLLLLLPLLIFAKDISGLERYKTIIENSIKKADTPTQKAILQNALKFVKSGKIIQGSCWDYINAIYNKSGVKSRQRVTIFKSSKKGPFAKKDIFKAGDWIYHINHSYHNIEHSGMFIDWIDKNSFKALMLSYAGQKKKNPARFRVYNIDSTYNIIRAKGEKMDNYIPLKEYAVKNKISIFNAMKLAKNGKIESITKEVNGKEQIFVKTDSKIDIPKPKKEPTLKDMQQEINALKEKVKELESKLDKCCKGK